jgi:hypothetical protein
VVRRVVGHEQGRRPVEPVHQQAGGVVERRVGRAAHAAEALLAEPVGGGVEERLGNGVLLHALEEAEEPGPVLVLLQVHAVDDAPSARKSCMSPCSKNAFEDGSSVSFTSRRSGGTHSG